MASTRLAGGSVAWIKKQEPTFYCLWDSYLLVKLKQSINNQVVILVIEPTSTQH